MDDARAALERTAHVQVSNRDSPEDDSLARWRRGVEQQEKEFAAARAKRQADSDAEQANTLLWQNWVADKIRDAVRGVGSGLGEILASKLQEIDAVFCRCDTKISTLERDLCRAQADIARLNATIVEMKLGRDRETKDIIDLPAVLPKRPQEMN
jgi:hypothetical protein